MSLMYMNSHTILKDQLYAWTKSLTSYWAMQGNHCPCVRVTIRKQIRNMSGMVPAARRIIKRLEIHYTPKHGSWLDIAEIELNVMTRQCLSRRIENIAKLRGELAAWEVERNTVAAKVNWQFRTEIGRASCRERV